MAPTLANPANPKCCCCFPIKIGAIVIGVLEFIGILVTLIAVITFYRQGGAGSVAASSVSAFGIFTGNQGQEESFGTAVDKKIRFGGDSGSLIAALFGFLIGTVSIIGLLIGVIKERPKLVLAHLIVQGLALVALVIGIIVYGLYASNTIPITDQELKPDHIVVMVNGVEVKDSTAAPKTLEDLVDRIKTAHHGLAVAFCVMMGIAMAVLTFFMYAVYKCFRYLANKALQ